MFEYCGHNMQNLKVIVTDEPFSKLLQGPGRYFPRSVVTGKSVYCNCLLLFICLNTLRKG